MTAIETLECRIDELCRENERLRGQVASLIGRSFRTADKMNCLNIENAKLRKLIADIHALDDLSYIPSWSLDEYGVRMADIERRMRELGLEVE